MPGLSNIQTQVQTQTQIQTLSPQQVLEARLLALSTLELEEHVRAELGDNPALEDGPAESLATDNDEAVQDDDLEYGNATIEIHEDAITPGQKVVIVDDLLATGGTMEAIIHLVERLGGKVVKIVFVLELKGLDGMKKLAGYDCSSLVSYEGK